MRYRAIISPRSRSAWASHAATAPRGADPCFFTASLHAVVLALLHRSSHGQLAVRNEAHSGEGVDRTELFAVCKTGHGLLFGAPVRGVCDMQALGA